MENNSENSFNSTNMTYDNYTDEELMDMILDHIKPTFIHWIFIVLFVIMFVVGAGGNFLVCYSVWRSQTLRNVTNYFLVNLSVSDLMVMLICMPATLTHDVTKSWFLGLAMCKALVYMQVRRYTDTCRKGL